MTRITKIIGVLCVFPLLWCSNSMAQQPEPPTFVPIEIFTCDYNKGKDYDDLQRVIDKWNKWADENFPVPYTAWVMTPNFSGPEQEFDVVWMGAWQNGKDMGAGLEAWNSASGVAMNAEFEKVVTCGTHGNMGSTNVKLPSANWPTETGVALFSDCKIAEGKSNVDALAAHRAIGKYLGDQGSTAGAWMMFPGYGAGDIDYSYKLVTGHDDYKSMGSDWENFANGGGVTKIMEISGGVTSCDSPRVYTVNMVRNGGIAAT